MHEGNRVVVCFARTLLIAILSSDKLTGELIGLRCCSSIQRGNSSGVESIVILLAIEIIDTQSMNAKEIAKRLLVEVQEDRPRGYPVPPLNLKTLKVRFSYNKKKVL
jgi:hypothetical protein